MLNKNIITLLLILLTLSYVLSQDVESDSTSLKPYFKNTLFAEIGGASILYSINYESLLINKSKNDLLFRVGASIIPGNAQPITFSDNKIEYSFSLGVNLTYKNTFVKPVFIEQSIFFSLIAHEIKKVKNQNFFNYALYGGIQPIGFRSNNNGKIYYKFGLQLMTNIYELFYNDFYFFRGSDILPSIKKSSIFLMGSFSVGFNFEKNKYHE